MTSTAEASNMPAVPAPEPKKRRRRAYSSDRLTGGRLVTRYIVLVVVLFLMIGPLVIPLLGAFKGPNEAVSGATASLLPQEWSLQAFVTLFETTNIVGYVGNSLFVAALNIASHLILATIAGYMLSRKGWRGRGLLTIVVISAMIFPFESIMLSLYQQIFSWGLHDTLIAVWLPGMLGPFHVLLMRAAFLGIPDEVEDAAYIDGAGEFRRFWTIFVPQVKGALVVVGLTSFIFAWQDFLWPLLILQSDEKYTMMLGIANLTSSFGTDYRVVLAGAIVAVLPVITLFFIMQRYFFRGIEEGGLKF